MVYGCYFVGNKIFHGFHISFLSMKCYMHGLRYNVCSAWFLDIRISACFCLPLLCFYVRIYSN